MGQSDSKDGSLDYKKILQDYNVKRKLNDHRFGEVTILEQKTTKEESLLREKTTNNSDIYDKELAEFRNRMQSKHPNVMQFLYYATKSENQFCSTFHKTYLLFEYSDRTLEDLINNSIHTGTYISEKDLWELTKGISEGLAFLQRKKIFHGEIRPMNIYISKQKEKNYKIFDQGLLDGKRYFLDLCTNHNSHLPNPYLSPLLVKAVEQRQMQPRHNEVKSDVYSLGVSVLHAANLESNDDCYDFNKGVIDDSLIERRLKKMQERYSPHLVSVLRKMLTANETARPDFIELNAIITSAMSQADTKMTAQEDPHLVKVSNSTTSLSSSTIGAAQPNPLNSSPSTGFNPATSTQTTKALVESHSIEKVKNAAPIDYHHEKEEPAFSNNYPGASNYINSYTESKVLAPTGYSATSYSPSIDYTKKEEVKNTSTGDVNYDDINALLRKYGIEPIQPRTYNSQNTLATTTTTTTNNYGGPSSNAYTSSYQGYGGSSNYEPGSYLREEKTVKSYNMYSDNTPSYTPYVAQDLTRNSSTPVDVLTRLDDYPKKDYTSLDKPSNYLFSPGFSSYDTGSKGLEQSLQSYKYDSSSYQNNLYLPAQTSIKREAVVEEYQNGSRYEGEKIGDMRNGRGKFYYSDGGVYDGEWLDNKMHGRGTLYYSSGKPAYVGDWHFDKFEGNGTLHNEYPAPLYDEFDYKDFDNIKEFWTSYEGKFKDDNKEGYGVLNLTNGDRFQGNFQEDLVHGPGKFIKKNGQIIEGSWYNNKLMMR